MKLVHSIGLSSSSQFTHGQRTLIEVLHWRASTTPDTIAYRFSKDGAGETSTRTNAELYQRAYSVSECIRERSLNGKSILLWYGAGPDFLEAFLGCLLAGALPVALPQSDSLTAKRALPRFKAIASAAAADILMTDTLDESWISYCPVSESISHQTIKQLELPASAPNVQLEATAFLQFTSGSTSAPKGIAITHKNLVHQLTALATAGSYDPESVVVNWMPQFHDYGLIAGLLLPLYLGVPCVAMPPSAFLRRPIRWLELLSSAHGTHSSAPPFAYDYCCQSLRREDVGHLELGQWRDAGIAAEPIAALTLHNFVHLLKGTGFQLKSFSPAFGLAENTLAVSYTRSCDSPTFVDVDVEQLRRNRVAAPESATLTIVGCGKIVGSGTQVKIVDPESRQEVAEDVVGEIWVAGDSVAAGYWGDPIETEHVFVAFLRDTGAGPFLRTGDLGFVKADELFITGRLKDVIILGGQNYYPQDLERTAESSSSTLKHQSCVAFSSIEDGKEQITLLAEARANQAHYEGLALRIRQVIAEQHGVDVYRVAIVKQGSIEKTSSGKLQRRECREQFLKGLLKVYYDDSVLPHPATTAQILQKSVPVAFRHSDDEILKVIQTSFGRAIGIAAEAVGLDVPLSSFSATSLQLTRAASEIGRLLGYTVSPVLFFEAQTIREVSLAVAGRRFDAKRYRNQDAKSLHEPIAVVGMSFRLPGCDSPDDLWDLIANGKESISEVPSNRWDANAFCCSQGLLPHLMITSRGGFIRDVSKFDRTFFNISQSEAVNMDPQQRLLLEVAWNSLEDAGYDIERLEGSATGVFVAISGSDYGRLLAQESTNISPYAGAGGAVSIAANRISYTFGLMGPSMVVDSACSSSLVAMHLACESLRRGEIECAIVGAVNLILTPELSVALSQAGFLSPEGMCKAFDESANGYVRSEGCAVFVLKRESDALRDADNVHAIVQGSAVNQDGRSYGLTAPNPGAQKAVITKALQTSGVSAADVSYFEAHGTGTPLGDAIEMSSIIASMCGDRDGSQPLLFVGSVKANVGHLEAAAGMAGLLKVILMLKHGYIPPQRNLVKLNPNIDLKGSRVQIATEGRPWSAPKEKIAGISSFGFGGTNAHLILSESHPAVSTSDVRPQMITLSAKNNDALNELVERYASYFYRLDEKRFSDACFTAKVGRSQFSHRVAIVAQTPHEAFLALRQMTPITRSSIAAQTNIQIHFAGECFSDNSELLLCPLLRQTYERVLGVLGPERKRFDSSGVALEYALGLVWESWGVHGTQYTGDGLGQQTADLFRDRVNTMSASSFSQRKSIFDQKKADRNKTVFAHSSNIILKLSAADTWRGLLDSMATLYENGVNFDWKSFYGESGHKRVSIPTYPFQGQPYWIRQSKPQQRPELLEVL